MYKRFRSLFLVVLCLLLVLGSVATSYAVGKPNQITVEGTLKLEKAKDKKLILVAAEKSYYLSGNTKGMEDLVGKKIVVKGIQNGAKNSSKKSFSNLFVISYSVAVEQKPAPTPTPTPDQRLDVLQGALKVVKPAPEEVDTKGPYIYYLSTEKGVFELIGSTSGLEKYNGKVVEVKGHMVMTLLPTDMPLFNVVSYSLIEEPLPTPEYTILQGALKVTDITPPDANTLLPVSKFELKTAEGPYSLQGNVAGLEKYNGLMIEVKGTVSPLKIYPPIFIVESYRLIESIPVPTEIPTVHTVISQKPLALAGPSVNNEGNVKGNITISWTENTDKAFFQAKLSALEENKVVGYEIELVAAKITDKDSIKGLFNISRDGDVIAKEISAEVYGLTQPLGSYFKFYSPDTQWYMRADITQRIDF